jgi:twitching motility protein PilU
MPNGTPRPENLESLLRYMNDHALNEALITPGAPICARSGGAIASTQLAHASSEPVSPSSCEQILKEIVKYSTYKSVDELPNETHIVVSWPKLGRYRVFVYRQRSSHAFSIRHVIQKAHDLSSYKQFPDIEPVALHEGGLILVGNTYTQKISPTLAALIQHRLNHRACHLLTIEDSIDVLYDHGLGVASQRELGIDVTHVSAGIESAKRSFSDTILIDCAQITRSDLLAIIGYAEMGGTVFLTGRDCNLQVFLKDMYRSVSNDDAFIQRIAKVFAYYVNDRLLTDSQGDQIRIHEVIKGTEKVQGMLARAHITEIIDNLRTGSLSDVEEFLTFDSVLLRMIKAGEITPQVACEYASSSYYRNRMLVGA